MEQREHVEHLVLPAEVDTRGCLCGIGQHVAVGEHHALGRALGPRGEQYRRPIAGDLRFTSGFFAFHNPRSLSQSVMVERISSR